MVGLRRSSPPTRMRWRRPAAMPPRPMPPRVRRRPAAGAEPRATLGQIVGEPELAETRRDGEGGVELVLQLAEAHRGLVGIGRLEIGDLRVELRDRALVPNGLFEAAS